MKKSIVMAGICCMMISQAFAADYVRMPVNVSLYKRYSIGHVIADGRPILNHVSINILTGRADRLEGIEFGGLANRYHGDVRGIQLAGLANSAGGGGFGIQAAGLANVVERDYAGFQGSFLANVTSGTMRGIQFTGLANVIEQEFSGIQAAGLANVVNGDSKGIQGAGLANVVEGRFTGIQWSGLANVVNDDVNAIMVSGLANVAGRRISGVQASGLVNVASGSGKVAQFATLVNVMDGRNTGAQLSALINVADDHVRGAQGAGLLNVSGGGVRGVQVGGLLNVVNGELRGVQAAGLINVGDDVRQGIQAAGLINVSGDMRNAIQVSGLVNVVNNAAHGVMIAPLNVSYDSSVIPIGFMSRFADVPTWYDVWAEATGFVNTGFRSGTERVHNFVFAGFKPGDPFQWNLGWGLGCHFDLSDPYFFEVDASVRHINIDEFWTNGRNLQTTGRLLCGWRMNDIVSLYAGPTFDYLVSEVNDGSDVASWSTSESRHGSRWERSWPGAVVGIRFERPPGSPNDFIEDLFEDIFSF